MVSLILSFAVLVAGYLFCGKAVERAFGPDDRETPAYAGQDGVDFIPMPTWKASLVQLLSIVGTGPIFGAQIGCPARDRLRRGIVRGLSCRMPKGMQSGSEAHTGGNTMKPEEQRRKEECA